MLRGRIEAVVLDLGPNRAEVGLTAAGEVPILPRSLAAALTTSATVGNRQVGLEYRDQADRLLFRASSTQAIVAGATWEVCAALDASPLDQPAADTVTLRMPELPLEPGWRVQLVIFGGLDGDEWGEGIAVVEYGPTTLRELAAEEYAEHGVHLARRPAGDYATG